MQSLLESVARIIDRITTFIGKSFSFLTLVTVVIMFFSVVQRYFFDYSAVWQQELINYSHAICFMTVSGYALMKDAHVRVDILYTRFSHHTKAYIEIVGTLMLLIPFALAILLLSVDFIASSWKIGEISREANGLPYVYILKTFIAVFATTLMLQSISIISKNVSSLLASKGKE